MYPTYRLPRQVHNSNVQLEAYNVRYGDPGGTGSPILILILVVAVRAVPMAIGM